MITTITQVCNLALSRLGARRLASYESDATVEANACRQQFDLVRDTLLRRHQWDFATDSKALSKLAETPLSEYAAAWQLPGDFVRLIRLSSGDPVNPIMNFTRRGRKLLTAEDFDALELIYVSNGVPIADWDSLFIDAMTCKLAAEIAADVAHNPTLATEAMQRLESLALPAAQTADARECNSGENFGTAAMVSQSQLVRARFGRTAQNYPMPLE